MKSYSIENTDNVTYIFNFLFCLYLRFVRKSASYFIFLGVTIGTDTWTLDFRLITIDHIRLFAVCQKKRLKTLGQKHGVTPQRVHIYVNLITLLQSIFFSLISQGGKPIKL